MGLIFIPSWYTNSQKTIEKLEFKDRISPELTALLTDDIIGNHEIYEIFVKHDDEMADYIKDAVSLKELLKSRLDVLEKQRYSLKEDLMGLTEKRLIKDIDRKEFSEEVMRYRRKVNILDVNINKCKELVKRLDDTSFGILGKEKMTIFNHGDEKPIKEENKTKVFTTEEIKVPMKDEYKEKYFTLKKQFEHLDSDYHDLKEAVEKIMQKNQL